MTNPSDGTPAALRAQNRERVLGVLLTRVEEGATQAELAEATGLSRPSIANILATFEPILESAETTAASARGGQRKRGRLGAAHRIESSSAWVAAMDIGRSHTYVGACDLRGGGGNIHHRVDADPGIEIRRSPLGSLERVADDLNAILDDTPSLRLENLAGLVLSLPGPVADSRPRDRILEWGDHDIEDTIREVLRSSDPRWREHEARLKVVVDNDANLSAVAEHYWGVGRGASNLFYVKWSSGLGGGVILDGALRRGAGGAAGEFGHTPVPAEFRDGVEDCEVCRQPCFEAAIGFKPLLHEKGWTYSQVQDAARDQSSPSHAAVRDWIEPRADLLGFALVPVVNTLNPELLVINGILDQSMEHLFSRIILRSLERNGAMPSVASDLKIRGGHFTVSAAARGGLALAFQHLVPSFLLQKTEEG